MPGRGGPPGSAPDSRFAGTRPFEANTRVCPYGYRDRVPGFLQVTSRRCRDESVTKGVTGVLLQYVEEHDEAQGRQARR